MEDKRYDVIVIGAGMAGAHAAWPLVEAGKNVLMLDGGVLSSHTLPKIDADFPDVRRSNSRQRELFLGADLETLSPEARRSHAASMASGNRTHVSRHTDELLPLHSEEVHIIQSLAKGGLSEAWGGVCAVLNPSELSSIGIKADMHSHYQTVMDMIGVSGAEKGFRTQSPAEVSEGAERLLEKFRTLGHDSDRGFNVRQPLLALLTEEHDGRNPTTYQDLDYYTTTDRALYRARYTIEKMEQRENFHYQPGAVVREIAHESGSDRVIAQELSGRRVSYRAKRIVLAAGAINTNRILLQSGFYEHASVLIKPNSILACIDVHSLGTGDEGPRHSLCQLTINHEKNDTSDLYAQIYSYRSLLLWRLKERTPLPAPEGLALLSMYAPSLFLVDVRVPGSEGKCNLSLEDGTLSIRAASDNPTRAVPRELKKFLRRLGLFTLTTAHSPLGASVHYAGGVRTNDVGEIVAHPGIFVADAASWAALPPKPLALTIMANANRIGEEVLRSL